MSSCYTPTGECATTSEAATASCPVCATKGLVIDRITLKALLTPDGLRRGVRANPRYCTNAHCDTVYFDTA